jgi:hypothetical protein
VPAGKVHGKIIKTRTPRRQKDELGTPCPNMPSTKAILCVLALLPLAQSSTTPPGPPLADALVNIRMAEPEAVVRVLTEVVRINPTSAEGGWLVDLRGFNRPEWQELSDLLRKEDVGLGDRSKLRWLASAATQSTATKDDAFGIPRRVQQTDGREEMMTSTQDHVGTAQPGNKQADGGSGLSGDSASRFLCHSLQIGSCAECLHKGLHHSLTDLRGCNIRSVGTDSWRTS